MTLENLCIILETQVQLNFFLTFKFRGTNFALAMHTAQSSHLLYHLTIYFKWQKSTQMANSAHCDWDNLWGAWRFPKDTTFPNR